MLRIGLIQTLELAGGDAETHTEARGSPFGQIEVDGREGDHLRPLGDFPVIVTIVKVRADAGTELPVVPETVRENGVLLHHRGGGNLAAGGRSFLDNRDRVFVFTPVHLDVFLSENGCRGQNGGRSNQDQCFFHID